MTAKEIEAGIAKLLAENANIGRVLTDPSEVTHIPFKGSRKEFFLLISLYVSPELVGRERLLEVCSTAALLAIRSGCLSDEKAVEVAAYVGEQAKLRRVVRLTILEQAFGKMMSLQSSDLLNKEYDGIACHWPLQPPQ